MIKIIRIFKQNNPVMDNNLNVKPKNEQYPLLKVTGGLGDNPKAAHDAAVAYSQRRPQKLRWPEKISTCWMSLILLGICVLTLYTVGVALTRRQAAIAQRILLVPASTFKPNSEVYFVQIIENKCQLPIKGQETYFKHMASSYPNLAFNVIYLVDDTRNPFFYFPKHERFYNYMLIQNRINHKYIFDEMPNIKISIMSLNKYLSSSLRFKWNTIPRYLATLYARIYTVWQYGGISMDFNYYYNKFIKNEDMGYEIKNILNQFNNGLIVRKDINSIEPMLNSDSLASLFDQVFAVIDYSFSWYSNGAMNNSIGNILPNTKKSNVNKLNENLTEVTTTKIEKMTNETLSMNETKNLNEESPFIKNATNITSIDNNKVKHHKSRTLFYVIDPIEPVYSYLFSKTQVKNENYGDLRKKVLIDTNATFIASYSKNNPFLRHLLSLNAYEYVRKNFIQDEAFLRCSNIFTRNNNCDVIFYI